MPIVEIRLIDEMTPAIRRIHGKSLLALVLQSQKEIAEYRRELCRGMFDASS